MSDKDQLVAASIKVSLLEATHQKFDTLSLRQELTQT